MEVRTYLNRCKKDIVTAANGFNLVITLQVAKPPLFVIHLYVHKPPAGQIKNKHSQYPVQINDW